MKFDLKTNSPLLIKASENKELDPILPDNQFIRTYKDGELTVVMPGSSIKGVFRNRAEKILNGCDIFRDSCAREAKRGETGEERYIRSCPACKIFGSIALKSRILFKDSFPIGEVKMGRRTNVSIDRITGAAKQSALFEPEVVENGTFRCDIKMENVFNWQIKVILDILNEINEGYVVFGGVTSRGFGRMSVLNIDFSLRYYDKKDLQGYKSHGFYIEKKFDIQELKDKLNTIKYDDNTLKKVEFDETL
jgi:CRISPR-associated RAMP protein (TIGR02581 family)